ncbi:class I SAM-dependent methyltransferase [Paenibacillus sp. D51F]
MSKLEKIRDAVNLQKSEYANTWSSDAQNYRKNNDYAWMGSFIEGCRTVVEIGTGDGSSTLSLLETGHVVIGIDENLECLKKTYDTLKKAGRSVKLLHRGNLKTTMTGYKMEYKRLKSEIPESGALLIEGDIINDPFLEEWLEQNKPFDAMVCWLIGSHGVRALNDAVKAETPGTYRSHVQNKVYEVADIVLREKGILHIVDRIKKPSNEEEQMILDSHEEQASVTSLKVSNLDIREQPHFELGKESMKLGSALASGSTSEKVDLVLASILSVKQ